MEGAVVKCRRKAWESRGGSPAPEKKKKKGVKRQWYDLGTESHRDGEG